MNSSVASLPILFRYAYILNTIIKIKYEIF